MSCLYPFVTGPADVLTKDDSSETDTEFVGVPLQRSPYPTLNFGFLQPSYAVSHRRGNPFLRASPWDDVEPKDILQATYITEMQGLYPSYCTSKTPCIEY